jgi:hypothetical protein
MARFAHAAARINFGNATALVFDVCASFQAQVTAQSHKLSLVDDDLLGDLGVGGVGGRPDGAAVGTSVPPNGGALDGVQVGSPAEQHAHSGQEAGREQNDSKLIVT